MTQNDIAFYSAKNQRRNMRLERKETKRHNLAQEKNQAISAQASMLGAQASQVSAGAAAQQAATKQKEYELEWESQYGMPYGNDPNDPNNYITVTDVVTGEKVRTTRFPETIGYSTKKAEAMEKLSKARYEEAGTKKQKMETFYGGVRIVREGIGVVNDSINLGTKVKNIVDSHADSSTNTGTDMIVYGGN